MTATRIAIIGAGIMGANHARVARVMPGVELAAVVDPDIERARRAAGPSAASFTDLESLGAVDLAIVAVPTAGHVSVATQLIDRGVNVLVEKPLASTSHEARRLAAHAEAAGVLLAVGHVERFNPAVVELARHLEQPLHVRAARIGPYSSRISDGVIHDLMIHDLDIVASLIGDDAEIVSVAGHARHERSESEDFAVASVEFSNGLSATFEASRLGQEKVRLLEVTQLDSVVVADLVRQDITVRRMSRGEYLSDEGTRYRQSSVIEIPFLETRGEPLALELLDVVDCVRMGRPPVVDAHQGVRALELAERVAASVRRIGAVG